MRKRSEDSLVPDEAVATAPSTDRVEGRVTSLSSESPWPGLRSFTEGNRDFFFGRRQEANELTERVLHRRLTVLYGPSGLGKTSLLRAGLMPKLRGLGLLPINIRLVFDDGAPPLDQQVVGEIVRQVHREGAVEVDPSEVTLWELCHDPVHGLLGESDSVRPVLIFDQFEEVGTHGQQKRPDDATEFMEALTALVENRPTAAIRDRMERDDNFADRLILSASPIKVLLSMREDYLHWIERWRPSMPSIMENRFELLPLTGAQAFLAVREPGQLRCRDSSLPGIVDNDTACAIVRVAAGAGPDVPIEELQNVPPLLNLLCEQLNRRRINADELVIQSRTIYQTAPDVLGDFYKNSLVAFPRPVQEFVEEQLLSKSGNYREAVTTDTAESELAKAGIENPRQVIEHLVESRLLAFDQRGGIARVELTHDVLAPIAHESRALRIEKRERERLEEQSVERRRVVRRRMTLMTLVGMLFTACVFGGFAWTQYCAAVKSREEAIANAAAASRSREEALTNFRRAEEYADAAKRSAKAALEARNLADKNAAEARAAQEVADKKAEEARYAQNLADKNAAEALLASETARTSEGNAIRDARKAAEATRQKNELLENASRSEYANGQKLLLGDVATSKRLESSTLAGRNKWHEVLANWTRALEFDPTNRQAARGLLSTLSNHGRSALRLPRKILELDLENANSPIAVSRQANRLAYGKGEIVSLVGKDATRQLRHQARVNFLAFDDSAEFLLTTSDSNTTCIWRWASGTRVATFPHNQSVTSACFGRRSDRVITQTADGYAHLWDLTETGPIIRFRQDLPIQSDSFTADGEFFFSAYESPGASGNVESVIDVRAASTGQIDSEFARDPRKWRVISSSRFSGDIAFALDFATQSETGGNPATQIVRMDKVSTKGSWVSPVSIHRLVWSDDGRMIAAIGRVDDGSCQPIEAQPTTIQVLAASDLTPRGSPVRLDGDVGGVFFSASAASIYAHHRDTIRVWSTATGRERRFLSEDHVHFATTARNGELLVTVGTDRRARVWDLRTDSLASQAVEFENAPRGLRFDSVTDRLWLVDGRSSVFAIEARPSGELDVASASPIGELTTIGGFRQQELTPLPDTANDPNGMVKVLALPRPSISESMESFGQPILEASNLSGETKLTQAELRQQREAKRRKPFVGKANWYLDFDAARAQAIAEKKMILTYFTVSEFDCGACDDLEKALLSSREFAEFSKQVVLYLHIHSSVEGEKYAKLNRENGVNGYPTFKFLTKEGRGTGANVDRTSVETISRELDELVHAERRQLPISYISSPALAARLLAIEDYSLITKLLISGDQNSYVVVDDGSFTLTDVRSGKNRVWPRDSSSVAPLALSHDGQRIAVKVAARRLRILERLTKRETYLECVDPIDHADFDPSGRLLLTISTKPPAETRCGPSAIVDGHTVTIWKIAGNNVVTAWMPLPGALMARFDAEGDRLLVVDKLNRVRILDSLSGRPVSEPIDVDGDVIDACFGSNDRFVYISTADRLVTWRFASVSNFDAGIPLPMTEAENDWAKLLSGLRFDEASGRLQLIDDAERIKKLDGVGLREPWSSLNDVLVRP